MKDSTVEKLNEKMYRVNEEKIKMKSENDRSIGDLELYKKVVKNKVLPQQEMAKAEHLEDH